MSAAITDKITDVRNAARPNSARASGTRSSGGTSLACDNLAGWPTASKVHFVTYQINSVSEPVAGTQLDCTGIVTSNTIGSFTVIDGTDTGNSVNDAVEMLPTAAWGQDLADALTSQHSRTGAHVGITNTGGLTTDTLSATGNATVGGTLGVTGAMGGAGYDVKTIKNSYKFLVYRNSAFTLTNPIALMPYDTKVYDTSTNIDVVTNKGRFTAPVAGFYVFSAAVAITTAGAAQITMQLYKNGSELLTLDPGRATGNGVYGMNGTSPAVSLAANDYIEIFAFCSGSVSINTGATNTWFSGYLLSQT